MVKGISRQVIVVHSPDPKLFEQAIFILKDGQEGVSEDALMKEANQLIQRHQSGKGNSALFMSMVWAFAGALATGIVWMMTALL